MDELSNMSGEQHTKSTESPRGDSPVPTTGESHSAPPRNVARTITSKRVVIPPNAKRIIKSIAPLPAETHVEDLKAAQSGDAPIETAPVSEVDAPVVSSGLQVEPTALLIEAVVETPPPSIADAETASTAASSSEPIFQETPNPFELKPSPILPAQNTAPAAIKPGGMAYTPNAATFSPVVKEPTLNRRGLELALWGIAGLLLVAAVIAVILLVFPNLIPFRTP